MHELSLAQSMLQTVEQALGGKRTLSAATVTLGLFSGVEVESLRFCFTEVAKAEGFGEPELIVNRHLPRARCRDCDAEYELTDVLMVCPTCGSIDRHIEGGYELTLDSVEVLEEEDDVPDAEKG